MTADPVWQRVTRLCFVSWIAFCEFRSHQCGRWTCYGPAAATLADLTGNGVQDARDVLASAPVFDQVEKCITAAFVRFNFSEESE